MGQDKKQLTKLLAFVKELYDHPDNMEFAAGIQAIVMDDLKQKDDHKRISEIYEYCIQRIIKEQAESLYKDFPLTDIKDELVSDYIKMERAHRDNNIDDFGIRLYRQIENIVRTLAKDETLSDVVSSMMDVSFFVNSYTAPQVQNRQEVAKTTKLVRTIADIVLITSKRSSKDERKKKSLSDQYATDMARLVIYFVCFGGMMQSGVLYEQWKRQTEAYSEIYSIRNRVHGGGECSDYDIQRYDAVKANATQSYFRLMSFLVFLVDGVKKGFPLSKELVDFADAQG